MLRNRGIRAKLLAVLALPILVLFMASIVLSAQAFGRANQAAKIEQLARGSGSFGELIKALQNENSKAVTLRQGRLTAAQLTAAQRSTDTALAAARRLIADADVSSLGPGAAQALVAASRAHTDLTKLRAGISAGSLSATQITNGYNAIVARDIALPGRIGDDLADRKIGQALTSFSRLQDLVDLTVQQRDVGAQVIAAQGANRGLTARFTALAGELARSERDFRATAEASVLQTLDRSGARPKATYSAYSAEIGADDGTIDVTLSQWASATTAQLQVLNAQVPAITQSAADQAGQAAGAARRTVAVLLLGSLLIIASVLAIGLLLARELVRPMRRLTAAASEVAQELPRMLDRMATPGQTPRLALPDLDVRATDEVGQLAKAFQNVNATTLRVAEEQAALRASIAEMFVNVARRNHVLLSRQLTFIDQLERSEENPDTLEELFRLDHLATRMRRNAESLIVLAGVDAGRRLRRPMPLSDVVRTSVSEIERYDRVDVTLQVDPPMLGHVALIAAHLMAEIMENATQFSNPDTRVIASTSLTSKGVRVTITDQGLGMTWDEINDANQRIANPPVTEVVGSQRLGFYVVGRLARRLDASVVLRPGRSSGTVVTIDLPPPLFEAGSVANLPTPEEDAAKVPADWSTPTVPHQPAPQSGISGAVAAPLPSPGGLPQRAQRGGTATPASSIPGRPSPGNSSPEKREPGRTGIFGGFRSRKSVVQPVSPGPIPPLPLPQTAAPVVPTPPAPVVPTPPAPVVPAPPAPAVPAAQTQRQPYPQTRVDLHGRVPTAPAEREAELSPLDPAWSAFESPAASGAPSARPPEATPEPVPVARPAQVPSIQSADPVDVVPVEINRPVESGAPTAAPRGDAKVHATAPPRSVAPATAPPTPPVPAPSATLNVLPGRPLPRGFLRRKVPAVGPRPPQLPTPSQRVVPLNTQSAGSLPGLAQAIRNDATRRVEPPTPPAPRVAAPVAPIGNTNSFLPPPGQFQPPAESVGRHKSPAPATPVPGGRSAVASTLQERSAMASKALAELSISTQYSPEAVQSPAGPGLRRRTPLASDAAKIEEPAAPVGARRGTRTATDVRTMLSGYQAGVQRGREDPPAADGRP